MKNGRLTPHESLLLAIKDSPPPLAIGDRVRVYYSAQDPIDVTVVGEIDRSGFVEVQEAYEGGDITYPVLASHCFKL